MTGFAGLRDFAVDELDRARGELQHVGEPRVLKFRIDGTHLVQENAALAGLLAKVEVGVPPGTHARR
ncbi:hypothetical protein HK19_00565 [Acetobacter persici]|nr:hypothetical protein HK19_00565 [Acetobacter persici]